VVHEVDAVIVGWRPGSGARANGLGSLVIALHDGDELRSVGSVGSGFDQRSLKAMEELLELIAVDEPSLSTDNIQNAGSVRWVRPELVAVVEYREVTTSEHLRAPVFKGMRSDKPPSACTVDQLASS
jgi:bifunctional non-homologous end joining protein LigD